MCIRWRGTFGSNVDDNLFLDEFEERNTKQQSIIMDQQKMIQVFKDEQNKATVFYDKQSTVLNEQCLREKNEVKTVCLNMINSCQLFCLCFSSNLIYV